MAEKPIVAFLGPKASYTHQAALLKFSEESYELRHATTIEDVFAAVQSGDVDAGVVPFENSSNGSVIFTLDLFADKDGKYPDILVTGEIYVPVKHCLLGHTSRADSGIHHDKFKQPWRRSLIEESTESTTSSGTVTPTQLAPHPGSAKVKPSQDISHIKKLYSHPQAWGQCKLFLNTYLKGIERQDVSSTSRAAEMVAEDPTGTSAAISSAIAARLNSLTFLAEGISDTEGNSTRFFVIKHRSTVQEYTIPPPSIVEERNEMPSHKSLVIFTVDHNQYGSFADALNVFKKYDLNLTSCNSRPSGEGNWQYVFVVEFQGLKREEGFGGAVNKALVELKEYTKSLRFLGSWDNKLME